jgi:hypothetical protein
MYILIGLIIYALFNSYCPIYISYAVRRQERNVALPPRGKCGITSNKRHLILKLTIENVILPHNAKLINYTGFNPTALTKVNKL